MTLSERALLLAIGKALHYTMMLDSGETEKASQALQQAISDMETDDRIRDTAPDQIMAPTDHLLALLKVTAERSEPPTTSRDPG